jgi:DNA-binding GntR family transcriptional regulator
MPTQNLIPERLSSQGLHATLPLQIADRIAVAIVEERFAPGERLKEVELATTFSVSRATVREAMRILERQRLVLILPQRGAQVTNLSRPELEDLFEIRAVLLGLASRRVALGATSEQFETLGVRLAALRAAVRGQAAYARASADLSLEVARSSGNLQLLEEVSSFALRIGRYARLGFASQSRREKSLSDWTELFAAYASRDGEAAEARHRQLSERNRDAALKELDDRERERTKSS